MGDHSALSREELVFWLGILRDHATFIRDNLGPVERPAIERAEALRIQFAELLQGPALAEAISLAGQLIEFKRDLLRRLTACRLVIHLHAADLNQMIDEAEEFLRAAGVLAVPEDPFARLLQLHRIWLADAGLHSNMLYVTADPYERLLIDELLHFERLFRNLHLQAHAASAVYGKTGVPFAALAGFTKEARRAVENHLKVLGGLEALLTRCEVVTSALPAMVDHMRREETHYLQEAERLLAAV